MLVLLTVAGVTAIVQVVALDLPVIEVVAGMGSKEEKVPSALCISPFKRKLPEPDTAEKLLTFGTFDEKAI